MDGDRDRVVASRDGSESVPTGSGPLAALREAFADLDDSTDELRKEARETDLNGAGC